MDFQPVYLAFIQYKISNAMLIHIMQLCIMWILNVHKLNHFNNYMHLYN